MAKRSGTTRVSSSSAPTGVSTTNRVSINDTETKRADNAFEADIVKNYTPGEEYEKTVNINGDAAATIKIGFNYLTNAYYQEILIAGQKSGRNIQFQEREYSERPISKFGALGYSASLKELIKKYNKS